jgi:hypothetical protein
MTVIGIRNRDYLDAIPPPVKTEGLLAIHLERGTSHPVLQVRDSGFLVIASMT